VSIFADSATPRKFTTTKNITHRTARTVFIDNKAGYAETSASMAAETETATVKI
jgi:hypothetical protein